jgi:hypothetical protein
MGYNKTFKLEMQYNTTIKNELLYTKCNAIQYNFIVDGLGDRYLK